MTPLAEQGNPKAQYALGTMYAEGSGVSKDYSEAMKWFRKSAEQGDPYGQYGLGRVYADGLGTSKDYSEAAKWFRKSAEQGIPQAQYALGAMYADGASLSRDWSEAAKWFRKAAEQRDPQAQRALGTLYGSGNGVSQDYAEAMKWYRKAAAQDFADAQWRVGGMYVKGEGVPKDYIEAEKWFRMAASQGDPHGQLWLGRLYSEGWGVNKNISEAAKWYKLAVDQFRQAGIAVEKTEAAIGTSASALLLKALVYPPEALALSWLSVSYNLKFAEVARHGATFHTTIDGKSVTIDKSNAETYITLFEERLNIYSNAVKQRGFQQLATEYETEVSQGCSKLGFSQGKTAIDQNEFRVQIAHGPFQGEIRHRGIMVESALAIEHAMIPEIQLVGQIQQGRIELKHEPSQCTVTLTANSSAEKIGLNHFA